MRFMESQKSRQILDEPIHSIVTLGYKRVIQMKAMGNSNVYFSHFQCLADDVSSAFVFKQILSE